MLKAVLFDLDGTLVNHTGALRAALAGLYRRVGEPAGVGFCAFKEVWERESDHQYQRYLAGELTFTGQRIARIRAILALAGHEVTDDGAMEVFRSYNVDYEAAWRLFDDVLPCLDNLGGYRLGVITNGDAGPQR